MALHAERDHMRKMATAQHKATCQGQAKNRWGWAEVIHRNPGCTGCVTDAERDLWKRLADEIDAYLDETVAEDLFGEMTTMPSHEESA